MNISNNTAFDGNTARRERIAMLQRNIGYFAKTIQDHETYIEQLRENLNNAQEALDDEYRICGAV